MIHKLSRYHGHRVVARAGLLQHLHDPLVVLGIVTGEGLDVEVS